MNFKYYAAFLASIPLFRVKQALYSLPSRHFLHLNLQPTLPKKEDTINKNNSNSSSELPYIKTSTNQTALSPREHGNPLHSNILLRIYPVPTREVSCSKPEFGVRNLAKYKKILFLEKNKFSDHNRNLLLFFQMQFLFQFRVAMWLLVGIGPVLNLKVALNSRYKSGLFQTTWGV